MLYFCSVQDLKLIYPSASRFDTEFDKCRKGVTSAMNSYMRRRLDYVAGVVEIFDTPDNAPGRSFNIWLDKKNIEPGSVSAIYDPYRDWANPDDNVITPETMVLDTVRGRLTIYQPTRAGVGVLRVMYNGGFPPIMDGGNPTDVMDCPPEVRQAAIEECSYRLDKLLNKDVNRGEDMEKGQKIIERKKVAGLLPDTAAVLNEYRKTFGTLLG